MLLYNVSGGFLPVLWMLLIFFSLGTSVTEGTYSAEMFPTAQRSTATSSRAVMSNLGAIAGLAAITALFPVFGSIWTAIPVLATLCFLVPVIVGLFFPETARRKLEEIAPDDAGH